MGGDLLHRLLIPQAADAVRLIGAHLLQQPEIGPVALVVADGTDAVDEVHLFAVHILLQIAPAVGHGVQKQLPHQLGHGLKKLLSAQGKAVVDAAGHKAHALALPVFADGSADGGAVECIHGGGQRLHVRATHGAPVQNRGKQCIIRGRAPIQCCDKLRGKTIGLEFPGGQDREVDLTHDFLAIFIHDRIPPANLLRIHSLL